MSRIALILIAALGVEAGSLSTDVAWGQGRDPHMDPELVPSGCAACHRGHGASHSPMLPKPQEDVCLACHGSRGSLNRQLLAGHLSSNALPPLLTPALAQPFVHPRSPTAFSRSEPHTTTCTSCHSPHRGMRGTRSGSEPPGRPLSSPKDASRFEYELCESCHGNAGATTQSLLDISRLLNPMNRSYHPVEAPAADSSPSVLTTLAGRQINCTDCHGNADPSGPKGPHGSRVRFLLKATHPTVDGSGESPSVYGLCYSCHDRQAILNGSAFPEHARHIVGERTACATCHNGHGSVANRALIRFGEETVLAGVSPSAETGRLAYVSEVPGSGACFLTCHGYDHAPEAYGTLELVEEDPSMLLYEPMTLGAGSSPWSIPAVKQRTPPSRERERRRKPKK